MRKDLDKMTPEELLRELHYQEDNFRYLVSDMIYPDNLPTTWYGRWWNQRREPVTVIVQIILGSIGILCIAGGSYWLLVLCLT